MAETSLDRLRRLLKDAPIDAVAAVSVSRPTGLPTPSVYEELCRLPVRDLLPLLDEEIDRVAELASRERRILELETELDRTLEDVAFYRDRLQVVENALMPFGDAGKRFWVTGDGSYADALRDVMGNGGVALRRAWDAMKGHGL